MHEGLGKKHQEDIKEMCELLKICEILKRLIPENVEVRIGQFDLLDDSDANPQFQVELHASMHAEQDIKSWLTEFEAKSRTKWTVRKTHPKPSRYIFRKEFECQHSVAHKRRSLAANRRFRNFECPAKLDFKIKLSTPTTKKRDMHVREGFPTLIKIVFCHSHQVFTTGSLSFLRPTPEIKTQFEEYFRLGADPLQALQLHQEQLRKESESEDHWLILLADASKNPRERTVRGIYQRWKADTRHLAALYNSQALFQPEEAVEELDLEQLDRTFRLLQDRVAEFGCVSALNGALSSLETRLRRVAGKEELRQLLAEFPSALSVAPSSLSMEDLENQHVDVD